MANALAHLRPNEIRALDACVKRLISHLDGQLVSIYLFGSKARGDFTSDSDLDLLIILEKLDERIQDDIHLLGARISLEYDVLINTHLVTRTRWKEIVAQQAPLWRAIRQDGILLMSD